MLRFLLPLAIIPAIFLSCRSKVDTDDNSEVTELSIAPPGPSSDNTEYAPPLVLDKITVLKFDSEKLLKSVSKIRKMKQDWVFFDPAQNYLFRYDSSGQQINRIGTIGKGPGEYNTITDFTIRDDEIIIIANEGHKILHFTEEGEVARELPCTIYSNALEVYKDGYILNTESRNPDSNSDVIILNNEGLPIDSFKNNVINPLKMLSISSGFLYKNTFGQIQYLPTYGHKVYKLDKKNEFVPYLNIDLGPDELDISKFTTLEMYMNSHFKYAFLSEIYLENKNIIFFYYWEDKRRKFAIYDKSRSHLTTSDRLSDEPAQLPLRSFTTGFIDHQYVYIYIRPDASWLHAKDADWMNEYLDKAGTESGTIPLPNTLENANGLIFRYKVRQT